MNGEQSEMLLNLENHLHDTLYPQQRLEAHAVAQVVARLNLAPECEQNRHS